MNGLKMSPGGIDAAEVESALVLFMCVCLLLDCHVHSLSPSSLSLLPPPSLQSMTHTTCLASQKPLRRTTVLCRTQASVPLCSLASHGPPQASTPVAIMSMHAGSCLACCLCLQSLSFLSHQCMMCLYHDTYHITSCPTHA